MLVARAQRLEVHGRPDLAAQLWKQILLADPTNQTALAHLSQDGREVGSRHVDVGADADAASAISAIPPRKQADRLEAAAYRALRQKRTSLAEQRFRAILAAHPKDGSALAGMGYAAMQRQDFSAALHWLQLAERHGTRNRGVLHAIATARFWQNMQAASSAVEQHRMKDAEAAAQAALRIQPGDPQATLLLAMIYSDTGRPSLAMPLYRQVAERNTTSANPEAWAGWLKTSASLQQPQIALAALDHLSASERAQLEQKFEFLVGLSDAYAVAGQAGEAEQSSNAEQLLARALALPENSATPARREQAALQYAVLCIRNHQYTRAAGAYRAVLDRDPNNASAWRGIVLAEHLDDRDANAWKSFEQMPAALHAAALQDAAFVQLLAGIQQSQGNLAAARSLLGNARKQMETAGLPPSPEMLRQQGGLALQLNDAQAAVRLYRAALARTPSDAASWTGLLAAQHQAGEEKQADETQRQMEASVAAAIEGNPQLAATYFQTMAGVEQSLG
ncbi:MAG: tetratricopeptide repeat protein, partial [Acidobacteriaceae bacterium]